MMKIDPTYPTRCISNTGKIHVVQYVHKKGTAYYAPACNEGFTLGIDDWPDDWKGTERKPTCLHCRRLMK